MARLNGKLQFEGTLDNLSFYKTQDGIIVRKKWGPNKIRMKRDKAFTAVVNHGKDFGKAAKYSSFFRRALRPLLKDVFDNRVTGRVNKLMLDLMKLDKSAEPGNRDLRRALDNNEASTILTGFEFNVHCLVKDHLLRLPELALKKGILTLEMAPGEKILNFPKGATHAGLTIACLRIDFTKNSSQLTVSDELILDQKAGTKRVNLRTMDKMTLSGHSFFIVQLCFYKKTVFGMEQATEASRAAAILRAIL
jgi:hypothetical protein